MPEAPSTPPHHHHRYLTHDEIVEAHTLHRAGHSYTFIANQLNCTKQQVGYAVTKNFVISKKHSGHLPRLTDAQVDELEAYIQSSHNT
ncbi:uncharacterized protein EI97DRAFT_434999 [Westerdykella ornata]|uniref:Transposase IS30-like HTH domain-containing protein n=1 Tax=Westerdykella ornata TaxID=318751 RepID=A0A6A6JFP5_WESOR|nr:uncharacterized protein EI97DRAFT_434999 [Westerdykella ornata]KAF2274446.1 hypothetical protein EI97DRAFT_434999 [Westerdykella ornata]